VWRGTATRLSAVHVDLYCDDAKAAPIALINLGVAHELDSLEGADGEALPVFTVSSRAPELGEDVTVHLFIRDHDQLRGALKADSRGRTWRGDLAAVKRLLAPDHA
jgi:hypothetical protein